MPKGARNAMRYAREVGCKVVFVNYRLAPQNLHPIFFEDCYAAMGWVYDNATDLGIDPHRIGIGGIARAQRLRLVCA